MIEIETDLHIAFDDIERSDHQWRVCTKGKLPKHFDAFIATPGETIWEVNSIMMALKTNRGKNSNLLGLLMKTEKWIKTSWCHPYYEIRVILYTESTYKSFKSIL